MTEKLIKDGNLVKKAKLNLISAIFFILGGICFIVSIKHSKKNLGLCPNLQGESPLTFLNKLSNFLFLDGLFHQ
ncbi:hypothetical protein ACT7C9_01055 [Bacillus cereus]